MKRIGEFNGNWQFLSNFYPVNISMDGGWYKSVEHAYQAAKTTKLDERVAIMRAPNPASAKRLGQDVTLRSDWEQQKLGIMLMLLRQKFYTVPELAEQLLATEDAELVEGNTWGDRFWGVCRGSGKNHLGKLLMQVRDELKARR